MHSSFLASVEVIESYTTTNERKFEEGKHQKIKNDTEIQLNAKNKITAIGAIAIPVLRHSFGITD
jgi:hypothetical protein